MWKKDGIHSMVLGVKSWAVQKDTKHNGVVAVYVFITTSYTSVNTMTC